MINARERLRRMQTYFWETKMQPKCQIGHIRKTSSFHLHYIFPKLQIQCRGWALFRRKMGQRKSKATVTQEDKL